MADVTLVKTRLHAGVWEGELRGADAPPITVLHLGAPVADVTLTALSAGRWALRIPIPLAALCDGVQTFLICDGVTGRRLDHFTLITGIPMEEDIRAEVDLLRAELDLLKRAFRQHCA